MRGFMLSSLPLSLLKLPFKLRLAIIAFAMPISFLLFIFTLPASHSGAILIIPIILSAWLFSFRGAIVSIGLMFLIALSVNFFFLEPKIGWQDDLLVRVLIGLCSALFVGVTIATVRYALERAEYLRCKAEEAEQQKSWIYEQLFTALQAEQQITLAYQQQKHLHELKDQFIVHVNHELRTPLTETYGYIDMLFQNYEQLDAETRRVFIERAREGCEELLQLVSMVQDASRTNKEVQERKSEQFVLASVIDSVLEQFDFREREKQSISFEPGDLQAQEVWADEHYVRQIFYHLLMNACKYAPVDKPIIISLGLYTSKSPEEARAPLVQVCIQDRGPGIPTKELPLLFERFVRLQRDLYGTKRGAGLGLFICKQLVEAMGERIWVESSGQDGEGSCFCFTLPMQAPEEGQAG